MRVEEAFYISSGMTYKQVVDEIENAKNREELLAAMDLIYLAPEPDRDKLNSIAFNIMSKFNSK